MAQIRVHKMQNKEGFALQVRHRLMYAFSIVLVMAALTALPAQAQTSTELYSFPNPQTDGGDPLGGLVRDAAGNLYGATYRGGAANAGVVYKLDTSNTQTVLYSFLGTTDGKGPVDTLYRSTTGSLYGVASSGGVTSTGCTDIDGTPGCGTIFKVTTGGHLDVLHSFHGADGANPQARLFIDGAGNFYGTTYSGGTSNHGTVYKLSPTNKLTILHSFSGGADGGNPRGRVILDSKGNLYGTAVFGGNGCELGDGCGVVFKITASGTFSVLHSFADSPDGAFPWAGLQWDSEGNMWGTTTGGGNDFCDLNGSPCGVVYKIRADGTETVFYTFDGSDGVAPGGGVILDASGNLYGYTHGDDRASFGAVYKLDPSATKTDLFRFTASTDGSAPVGTLILDGAGNLYGTAQGNGGPAGGEVFKIAP